MGFFRLKVHLWIFILIPLLVVGGLAAAVFAGGLNLKTLSNLLNPPQESTHTSETVMYLLPKREVILASAHIQGVERSENDGTWTLFPNIDVQGGERIMFVQYEFDAQLGIDGGEVKIHGNPETGLTVEIPEFQYLGNDKPRFEDPIEASGALSWLTDEINVTEMHNAVLSGRNQEEYVTQNEEMLREQAELFYSTVIRSVTPEAQLTFIYASDEEK